VSEHALNIMRRLLRKPPQVPADSSSQWRLSKKQQSTEAGDSAPVASSLAARWRTDGRPWRATLLRRARRRCANPQHSDPLWLDRYFFIKLTTGSRPCWRLNLASRSRRFRRLGSQAPNTNSWLRLCVKGHGVIDDDIFGYFKFLGNFGDKDTINMWP